MHVHIYKHPIIRLYDMDYGYGFIITGLYIVVKCMACTYLVRVEQYEQWGMKTMPHYPLELNNYEPPNYVIIQGGAFQIFGATRYTGL